MTAQAIHHPKRGTVLPLRHNGRHLVATETPLERFLKYCQFDPTTGCVIWTGGTTQGHGHTSPYGAFWFEGRRWSAHRWAAQHIHGLDIDGLQVDHCCPHTGGLPNTLCVEHVQVKTLLENRALQTERGKVVQSNLDRQYWLLVQLGIERSPQVYQPDPDAVPFFEPPAWLPRSPRDTLTIDMPF